MTWFHVESITLSISGGHSITLRLRRTQPRVGRNNDSIFSIIQTRGAEKRRLIAGVLVVLGMFLTPGAAVAGLLHESTWPGCFPLRSSGMFAHACCVTTRVTAGGGGVGLALWLCFQASRKQIQTTPRSIILQTFFNGNPGEKKCKRRKFTSTRIIKSTCGDVNLCRLYLWH